MSEQARTRGRLRGRIRERTRSSSAHASGARVPGALAQLAVVLRTPARAAQPLFAQAPKA